MRPNLTPKVQRKIDVKDWNTSIVEINCTKIIEDTNEIEFYNDENEYAGFIQYSIFVDKFDQKFAYIENIKVVYEQRQKIGTIMFNYFYSFIEEDECSYIAGKLSYHTNHVARSFFTSMGCFVHGKLDYIFKDVYNKSPRKPDWVI